MLESSEVVRGVIQQVDPEGDPDTFTIYDTSM